MEEENYRRIPENDDIETQTLQSDIDESFEQMRQEKKRFRPRIFNRRTQ